MRKPNENTVNGYLLTTYRSTSLLSIVGSMIIWTLACIYRPWKLQMYRGDQMEIGVWTICRVTPKHFICYDGWYEKHFKWWFVFWRYLMVAGIGIQLVTFTYMTLEVARRPIMQLKPWNNASLGCGLAGLCFFTSLIIFYAKFEWEFAEQNFGWPYMGWNEETPDKPDYIETVGYPYIMAWVGLVWIFIACYLCSATYIVERKFIAHERLRRLKEKVRSGGKF